MTKADPSMNTFHEDAEMFRSALTLTQKQTAFAVKLIEKDYFCTLLLEHLALVCPELIFKGGTCLAKVYANFYRLSEDLDFVIPIDIDAPRSQRSKKAAPLKATFAALPQRLPYFRLLEPLVGANNSTQYNAVIGYTAIASGEEDTINVEIGLREPLLMTPLDGEARTILLDAITGSALLNPVAVRCIYPTEAFAEKFRAALSRREVAARDFFDLDYAVRKLGIEVHNAELIDLVKQKMAVRGNPPLDVSDERLKALKQQVDAELRPVLRVQDFGEFDVERAFLLVRDMARNLS